MTETKVFKRTKKTILQKNFYSDQTRLKANSETYGYYITPLLEGKTTIYNVMISIGQISFRHKTNHIQLSCRPFSQGFYLPKTVRVLDL